MCAGAYGPRQIVGSCDRWINFVYSLSSSCRVCLPVVAFVFQLSRLSTVCLTKCLTVCSTKCLPNSQLSLLSYSCRFVFSVTFVWLLALLIVGTKGNRCNCLSSFNVRLRMHCASFNRCPSLEQHLGSCMVQSAVWREDAFVSSTSMINNVEAVRRVTSYW
jgi:hypothetical protein